MINVNDRLPEASFMSPGENGPEKTNTTELFNGKKAVLFAVPGAFTPTCNQNHLPSYIRHHDSLKAKGVDTIACVAVNDVFVMGAWRDSAGAAGKVTMLADGSAKFTTQMGMTLDLTEHGLGVRSKRYAMLIDDGVVKDIAVEDTPGTAEASGAEAMLAKL